jgi:acyl carrier protein
MEFDAFVTILKNDVGIMKENITMQDRLVEDLCMNSLSYMILISSIERKLEINFPIEQIKKMDTVGEFYSFIQAFYK